MQKIVRLFKEEAKMLQEILNSNPELMDCYEAIMNLRNCPNSVKSSSLNILSRGDMENSFLNKFKGILSDDYMNLPIRLSSLLIRLKYNIIDDGFLRLCKIAIVDDIDETLLDVKDNNDLKNLILSYEYWLTANEDWKEKDDIAKKWLESNRAIWINPKIVSFEMVHFHEKIENFTNLIKLLSDVKSYDKYFLLRKEVIDDFFNKLR